MRKTFTLILPAVFLLCSALLSQILPDKRQHTLVLEGIDHTLKQEYRAAEQIFQTMITEKPNHPAGYLYLAGMLQAENADYGTVFNEQRYDSLLNIVEMHAQPLITEPSTAAYGYFYEGSAKAFRSYTRSENGNLASGIYYGLSAGSTMEKCLEADPNFIEAKNILGSFYFWRSKLSWLPFVPDKRAAGIAMITEAFSHPYEKHLACHTLTVILNEEKRYAEAERYAQILLREYPENRLFLLNLMSTYEQWGRWEEMHSIAVKLLNGTLTAPVTNRYTEAVCRLKIAKYYIRKNDPASARVELLKVLSLRNFIGKTKGDLRKKLVQAEELLATID